MRKDEKQKVIEWVQDATANNETVIFSQFNGLTVAAAEDLRDKIRTVGAQYKVIKNTLLRIGLANRVEANELTEILKGTTGVAVSTDPVSLAKVLKDFAKESDAIEIKGALLDNIILSAPDAIKLASMPSKDELLGQLVGMLMQPMTKMAGVLSAPLRDLASVLGQIKEQKSA